MKPYYRPATVKDSLAVANNMRPEDRREIEGLGHSPLGLPFCTLVSSPSVAFFDEKDRIAGVAGIIPETDHIGQVWMICTPVVQEKPQHLVRGARRWLNEDHGFRLLWNLADARNHFHQKMLKLLGFKAIRTVYTGPQNLPYLEIVRLCV